MDTGCSGVTRAPLQMLEEKVVCVGTLLLRAPGAGSAVGSFSSACPTSSPAEIMEQRLSNRHPGLAVPGPVQLQSPHHVLAALGAAGLGRMAWERGMWICAGGWSPSFLLGQGTGNPKKFCKASGSLLRGGLGEGFVLDAGGACKRNHAQLVMTRLGLVAPGAPSAGALLGEGLQPWGCGMALHPAGWQLLLWTSMLVG